MRYTSFPPFPLFKRLPQAPLAKGGRHSSGDFARFHFSTPFPLWRPRIAAIYNIVHFSNFLRGYHRPLRGLDRGACGSLLKNGKSGNVVYSSNSGHLKWKWSGKVEVGKVPRRFSASQAGFSASPPEDPLCLQDIILCALNTVFSLCHCCQRRNSSGDSDNFHCSTPFPPWGPRLAAIYTIVHFSTS